MGITYVQVSVANVASPENAEDLEFLVDSGAVYSVVPAPVLERLEIRPLAEEVFRIANGERTSRKKGGALFKYSERVGVEDVIFGEPGDANLLGTLTLESLGLALDPLKRELRELPMLLAGSELDA
jgi:predicted aspartyl protease